jgi:hypothetical protein
VKLAAGQFVRGCHDHPGLKIHLNLALRSIRSSLPVYRNSQPCPVPIPG